MNKRENSDYVEIPKTEIFSSTELQKVRASKKASGGKTKGATFWK